MMTWEEWIDSLGIDTWLTCFGRGELTKRERAVGSLAYNNALGQATAATREWCAGKCDERAAIHRKDTFGCVGVAKVAIREWANEAEACATAIREADDELS